VDKTLPPNPNPAEAAKKNRDAEKSAKPL